MLPKLILNFVSSESELSLFSTEFFHPAIGESRRAIRGRTSGPFQSFGSYPWSAAVQALTLLCMRTKCGVATIQGGPGSLALSLDYAIAKGPAWLIDIFGSDVAGRPFASRLFKKTNTQLKNPGPVVLAFNERALDSTQILVTLNGTEISLPHELAALRDRLELQLKVAGKSSSSDTMIKQIATRESSPPELLRLVA